MKLQTGACKPDIERLLTTLRGGIPDRVPLLELVVHSPTLEFVMQRQLGGGASGTYDPVQLVEYEKKFADRMRKPHVIGEESPVLSTLNISPDEYVELCRRTGMDAMMAFLSYTGQTGLSTRGHVSGWDDLEQIVPPPDMEYVRRYLQRYLDAARGTGVGVAPWLHGCFARTYELLGFENFAFKLYDDRKLVEHVMDMFTDYGVAVAETVAATDISFFWIADDLADNRNLLVSPRVLEQLWVPRMERILAPVRARNIPIAYHCDGNLTNVLPFALRLGVDAIQPFQANCNDIYQAKKQFGDRICLMGNIDVGGVLAFGTAEETAADTRRHIEELSPGGRYILGSSHTITPAVQPENFVAMVETALAHGSYAQ